MCWHVAMEGVAKGCCWLCQGAAHEDVKDVSVSCSGSVPFQYLPIVCVTFQRRVCDLPILQAKADGGIKLEGGMALYNLKHFELVRSFCGDSLAHASKLQIMRTCFSSLHELARIIASMC